MAVQTINVAPLDPNNFTGPSRLLAGVARTGSVTADTYYGPNGSVEFARWLYVGTSGNVTYVKWDGTTQLIKNLSAGVFHPILSIQVTSSGTTATDLVWGS